MAMRRQRGYQAKQRNTGARKRRSVILISTEGKNKTESQYFNDFAKAWNLNIKFAPGNYTDPINMVKTLRKEYHEREMDTELGDKAYCLVDSDVDPRKNSALAKADAITVKDGLRLIVSSPCFEIWCLCHFGKSTTQYSSSSAVIDDLRKKLPGYKKSGEGLYSLLAEQTKAAIENAEFLEKACLESGRKPHTVEFSPSTEVYQVVKELLYGCDE